MADQIGYEFTADDRKLLESLNRFESRLDDLRADAKKLSVDTNKAFNDITRGINDAQKKAGGFRNVFSGVIAADIVRQGVTAVRALGNQAVKEAANFEQLNISFTTFLDSSAKANKLLEQLTKTAANTPFEQDEIFQGARQLLAYGIEAEKVNDQLIDLGNISAGVAQPLSRIVNVFGQITAKGRLTGEELRQLREAGVNPISELADVLNVAEAEIEDLISAGKVSSDVVSQAFKRMTSEGGRFNDLMKNQSTTFTGLKSNFLDSFNIILREFGTGLLPTLKDGIESATEFLRRLDPEKIREFGKDVGRFVTILVPMVKQLFFAVAGFTAFRAIGALRGVLGGVTGGVRALTTAIKANPIGFLAGTIVTLLPYLTTLIRRISGTTKVMEEMSGVIKDMRSNFIDEIQTVTDALNVFADLNSTQKERQRAYDLLNEKYPEIIAKYDLEKGRLEDLISLQNDLRDAIIDRIREERLGEAAKDFQKKLEEINKSTPSIFGTSNVVIGDGKTFGIDQSDIDEFRKKQKDAALAAFKDTNEIINKSADELKDISVEFAGLNTKVAGAQGRAFGQVKTQQQQLNDQREREKKLQLELNGLTTQQLRTLSRQKDTDELKKKLALEIVKAREDEARANAGNKKELEDARKALDKYNDTVEKIAEDIKKANAENISDPFKQLAVGAIIALEQSEKLFTTLREEAKAVGADITEIDKLETAARLAIEKKYLIDLQKLRKEKREQDLNDFLEFSRLQQELNIQSLAGTVSSDGINTSDELLRVATLEAQRKQLEEELNKIIQTYGIFSTEAVASQVQYNAAVAELDAARTDNKNLAIDREEDLLLREIDLIKKSGDSTLTLEEFKGRKRLEIQIEFAKRRIDLLIAEGEGEQSPEVKQLRSIIAAYEHELENFGEGDIFDKIKDSIAGIFKIDRDVIDQALETFGEVFNNLNELVGENTRFQIEQEQILLDSVRDRIEETKDALEKEQEDKADGYAANVKSKTDELKQLEAEEKRHQTNIAKFERQQLRDKLAADALTQLSSVITMVANVVAAESGKGLLGVATGLAAITGFLLLFKQYKNQAKALTQRAYRGGKIDSNGWTDKGDGRGHRVEGTNLVVGKGEYIMPEDVTTRHESFFDDVRAGKYNHVDLNRVAGRYKREPVKMVHLSRDLSNRVEDQRDRSIVAFQAYDERIRKDSLREVFSGEVSRLIDFIDNQPQYLPLIEGSEGFIEKRKNKTRRVRMRK